MACKGRKEPKAQEPARSSDPDVDTFAADALDFCGGESIGCYPQFLAFMEERGLNEAEVERLTEQVNKRAGRA